MPCEIMALVEKKILNNTFNAQLTCTCTNQNKTYKGKQRQTVTLVFSTARIKMPVFLKGPCHWNEILMYARYHIPKYYTLGKDFVLTPFQL